MVTLVPWGASWITASALAHKFGLQASTVHARIDRGWPYRRLGEPAKEQPRPTTSKVCRDCGERPKKAPMSYCKPCSYERQRKYRQRRALLLRRKAAVA